MLFKLFTTSLLLTSALAAPAESTAQATDAAQVHPAVVTLQQTAGQLATVGGMLRGFTGNPAQAAQIAQQLSVVNQGVNIAADAINSQPNLDWGTAFSFLPVITSLIAGAKSVTDNIEGRAQYFNAGQMFATFDQSYQAVSRLRQAFDNKIPNEYTWIISGLSSGTLQGLANARGLFASAAPAPAPYLGAYPASPYGAPAYAPPAYGAPAYPAAGYAPRPYRA